MAITGPGTSRRWLTPVRPDGTRPNYDDYDVSEQSGRVVGNWTGHQRGNNIKNPRPGYQYQYATNNSNCIADVQARGWELVRREDDDHPLFVDSPDGPTPNSDYCTTRDVILVRIPNEKLAELRNEEDAQRREALAKSGRRWFNSTNPKELASSRGRPTRFVLDRHHTAIAEGNESNIVEMLQDDVPRENF